MSTSEGRPPGIRFACPGCDALLKFKRIPTRLVQSCPNCRRLLRLKDKMSATLEDTSEFQSAIDEFVTGTRTSGLSVAYEEDPRLDQISKPEPGVWKFDQPWPDGFTKVVLEHAEVVPNPYDIDATMLARKQLFKGFHRRVTMERTGEVEEIVVTGHWREHNDGSYHDRVVGWLPRATVRRLNELPYKTIYATRINSAETAVQEDREWLKMYIDIATAPTLPQRPKLQKPIK